MAVPSLRADTFITGGRPCLKSWRAEGCEPRAGDPGKEGGRLRRQRGWTLAVGVADPSLLLPAEAECGTGSRNFGGGLGEVKSGPLQL